MSVSTPKTVKKITNTRPISPLSRADLSKPKALQQELKAAEQKAKQEERELLEKTFEESNALEEEIINSMAQDKPAAKTKVEQPPVARPAAKPIPSKKAKIEEPELPSEDSLKELDNVLDNAEDDLSFLSSGGKQKQEEKKETMKASSNEIKLAQQKIPARDEPVLETDPFELEEEAVEYYKEQERRYVPEMSDNSVTLDFGKKFESCYLPVGGSESSCEESANIFLREVEFPSHIHEDILHTHNDHGKGTCIASPFKFFTKPDFVKIFQKAFLGIIFDLSYSTPYYYTKSGTHHIYISSQIIEQSNMLHVVLLDLIPKKAHIYDQRNVLAQADFVDFSLHRALLVSANALYL